LRVTTIASHRRNICRKFGAHSTAELVSLSCSRPRFTAMNCKNS
jgi:DNA-binding NarL/FixJ family response regulator